MEEILGMIVRGCRRARELEVNVLNAYGRTTGDLPDQCEEIAAIFREASDKLRGLNCHVDHDELDYSLPFSGTRVESIALLERKIGERREMLKRSVQVAAPLHGNTEMPPDDGFSWRKYGQKEILNHQFPRGYYRCTHQRVYGCSAKKQVQRQNNNPNVFQVTYAGQHTCHISSTAGTANPPPLPPTHHRDLSINTSLYSHRYLPIASNSAPSTSTTDAATSSVFDNHWPPSDGFLGIGDSGGTGGGDHTTVVDMADAMFNTAPTSIDFIFSDVTHS